MSGKRSRFVVPGALTQGISQALQQGNDHAGQMHFELVPLVRIDPDPANPRHIELTREDLPEPSPDDPRYINKIQEMESLQGLVISIKRYGVQQPIVVYRDRERFRIAMGGRRFLASLLAGREHIPARIWARRPDDLELRLLQYVENVQRLDLTAWERVQNIKALRVAYGTQFQQDLSATQLAEIAGFSLSQASLYMQLIVAPDDVQEALSSGRIGSLDKAALIAKLPSKADRAKAIEAVMSGGGRELLRRPSARVEVVQKSKAGRPPTQIKLGTTRNTEAVRRVVEAMANEVGMGNDFLDVDWKDMSSASNAWAKLWQRLEGKG